jgi:phosphoglycerate kinase
MARKQLQQLDVKGRRVLCRVDFNVSMDKKTGAITDDTRIVAALPTINWLVEHGAKLILCSHLGRPDGERKPNLTLKPVATRLSEHLGKPVAFADDCIGAPAQEAVAKLKAGEVLLLENLRYHAAEEENDPAFCAELAKLCDVYVNDAFGAAHRAHGSTEGVAHLVAEKAPGLLLQKEIEYLGKATENPESPYVVILGGAKISGKLQVIENLLPKCDTMLIGGGMAYTFLKAQGLPVGKSLVEDDLVEKAKELLKQAKDNHSELLLPLDHVVAEKFEANAPNKVVEADQIPDGWMALDIGPKTIAKYSEIVSAAKTVVWNGPQGVFELEPFNKGTFAIAHALAKSGATSIVGGGESVAALNQAGVADQITHISTGGGASLEFLEGKTLPGVAAL